MRKSLTNMIVSKEQPNPQIQVQLGRITSVDKQGHVRVSTGVNSLKSMKARLLSSSNLEPDILPGTPVLLFFEDERPESPIVLGSVVEHICASNTAVLLANPPENAVIDGKTVVLEGKNEIRLNCGKSSIILTRDGRVVVKGVEVVSRGMRTNKIKGGSVQIN